MDVNLAVNPTYPLFPVISFLSFVLVLFPLPWHFQAWNAGTCAYMIWAAISCLIDFINSVVWRNNALNVAPVWCDISSKILLGAGVGIPAAGLCISRRLYIISSIKYTVVTAKDKRNAVMIDFCIAFGIPLIVMALHYVVQGHRFDILQDVGCWPSIYNTLPAYFLLFMWPTLLGCISFVFSTLTLRAFIKRRSEFKQLVTAHNSLNPNRYLRLMLLAVSDMLCTIPISVYSVYIANKGVGLQPWISWANVHYDFSFVGEIPAVEWMSNPIQRTSVELTRSLFPTSALLFFLLFGFAAEARKNYYTAFLFIAKSFGYRPASACSSASIPQQWKANLNNTISVGSLPVYVASKPPQLKQMQQAKRAGSFISPTGPFDNDVEKSAGCPSPLLPDFFTRHQNFSLMSGCPEVGPANSRRDNVDAKSTNSSVLSPASPTIPAFYRPFAPPSVCPIPPGTLQELQSPNHLSITQAQHLSAV